MRLHLFVAVTVASILLLSTAPAKADTHAPTTQTFTLQCGGQTVTVVSPTEHALAGQVIGATGVGILLRVTLEGTVLFESPAVTHVPGGSTKTCTTGPLTLTVLMTPPTP
jgi:hypothetical protein